MAYRNESQSSGAGLENYKIIKEIGKGTYGCVYEALDKRQGCLVALKRVLPKVEREGFPITAVREIKALKLLSHMNILELKDVVYQPAQPPSGRVTVYMVFPFIKHDMVGIQHFRHSRLSLAETKCITMQVLKGLEYLHSRNIVHRDLKLANLLVNEVGIVKIADFGLARMQIPERPDQTNKVVTRWYRPPELLLGATKYDFSVDIWSVGAILGELVTGSPLFPGDSEVHVLRFIFDTIGPPTDGLWPGFRRLSECAKMISDVTEARRELSDFMKQPIGECKYDSKSGRPVYLLAKDGEQNYLDRQVFKRLLSSLSDSGQRFMASLLQYDPSKRPSASKCLRNAFFEETPTMCYPDAIYLPSECRRELQVKEGIPILSTAASKRCLPVAQQPLESTIPIPAKRRRKA